MPTNLARANKIIQKNREGVYEWIPPLSINAKFAALIFHPDFLYAGVAN
jgi:hypothetical protein